MNIKSSRQRPIFVCDCQFTVSHIRNSLTKHTCVSGLSKPCQHLNTSEVFIKCSITKNQFDYDPSLLEWSNTSIFGLNEPEVGVKLVNCKNGMSFIKHYGCAQ